MTKTSKPRARKPGANNKAAKVPSTKPTLKGIALAAADLGVTSADLDGNVLQACLDNARLIFEEVHRGGVKGQLEFLHANGWTLAGLDGLVREAGQGQAPARP